MQASVLRIYSNAWRNFGETGLSFHGLRLGSHQKMQQTYATCGWLDHLNSDILYKSKKRQYLLMKVAVMKVAIQTLEA